MKMKVLAVGVTVLMSVMTTSLFAAKPVKTPAEQLRTERNMVGVFEVQTASKKALSIRTLETLHGTIPAELNVEVPENAEFSVSAKDTVILVYSHEYKDPMLRDVWLKYQNGPQIQGFSEVNAAVFPDTKAVRALFDENTPAAQRVSAALAASLANDRATQLAGALELFVNPALSEHYAADQLVLLQTTLDQVQSDHLKGLLLRAAQYLPQSSTPFLPDFARKELKRVGAQFNLATHTPALALACVNVLEKNGSPNDFELLAPLLSSNAPAVSRQSLKVLNAISPEKTKSAVSDALNSRSLSLDSKRELSSYLNR